MPSSSARTPGSKAAQAQGGRSESSFEKQRRAVLRLFAGFLIGFVTGRPDLPTPLSAVIPSGLAVASGPAAVIGRRDRRWALVDLAFMVSAGVLRVVMVLDPSGPTGQGHGGRPTPAAATASAQLSLR